MINVDVQFYAQLKDFFGDQIVLELSDSATVSDIIVNLGKKNALALELLKVSRVANDEAFLESSAKLLSNAKYFVLPPSSGG